MRLMGQREGKAKCGVEEEEAGEMMEFVRLLLCVCVCVCGFV